MIASDEMVALAEALNALEKSNDEYQAGLATPLSFVEHESIRRKRNAAISVVVCLWQEIKEKQENQDLDGG